jgi:hypothetical protein
MSTWSCIRFLPYVKWLSDGVQLNEKTPVLRTSFVKISRSQYLASNSSGCNSARDFLIGQTKHKYVIPRLSASVTYALLKLKFLTPRPGNPRVRTKPCACRTTCVSYLDILITDWTNMWYIRLSRILFYFIYISQSIYLHEQCGNTCFLVTYNSLCNNHSNLSAALIIVSSNSYKKKLHVLHWNTLRSDKGHPILSLRIYQCHCPTTIHTTYYMGIWYTPCSDTIPICSG